MRLLALLVTLSAFSVHAEPPPSDSANAPLAVDEIVRRTVAVSSPARLVCRVDTEVETFDGSGKPADRMHIESEETRAGQTREQKLLRFLKNGNDETAKAIERQKKDRDKNQQREMIDPLAAGGPAHYAYQLLRRETLWGHPSFVIKVTARERKESLVDGTAWVDAERFIQLKGEYAPAKRPDHVDWLKMQTQYEMRDGAGVPSYLKLEGGGSFLFVKRSFRSVSKWRDCK